MLDFKAKYADQWAGSNHREAIALQWLQLLGIHAVPTGHGTLIAEKLPGYHHGAEDKFDLYAPFIGCWFEVTGTSWRREDSARRFPSAVLPVLKAKVDAAEYYGVEGRLWFVSVNEIQGEVRFLRCRDAKLHPLISFAKGEGEYYGVPWGAWLTPARALARLARGAVRSG